MLATDGLWDEVKRKEAAQIATKIVKEESYQEYEQIKGKPFTFQLSYILCQEAQKQASKRSGYTLHYLQRLEPGPSKRDIIDDITILVANLQEPEK